MTNDVVWMSEMNNIVVETYITLIIFKFANQISKTYISI